MAAMGWGGTTEEQQVELLRAELTRRTDEVELLRELLSEATGLSLEGVGALVALHRRASGVQDLEFGPVAVLNALGSRWWRTGVIARALLVNGGKGLTARQRSNNHKRTKQLLQELAEQGYVERRRISEVDGRVMSRAESGQGHTEWRRVTR
jgi:hypothetical protein